jgi:hypothetical protein
MLLTVLIRLLPLLAVMRVASRMRVCEDVHTHRHTFMYMWMVGVVAGIHIRMCECLWV